MMKIAPRKAVLLGALGVLLTVYAFQLVLDGRDSPKSLMAEGIDFIAVEKTDGTAWSLSLTGDVWTAGSLDGSTDRVPADQAKAKSLAESLGSIRVLSVVSAGGDGERFGFADDAAFRVTAKAKGKTVRALVLGKTASIPSQSYLRADGNSEILLVSGDFPTRFGEALEDMKQKETAPPPSVEGAADQPLEGAALQ